MGGGKSKNKVDTSVDDTPVFTQKSKKRSFLIGEDTKSVVPGPCDDTLGGMGTEGRTASEFYLDARSKEEEAHALREKAHSDEKVKQQQSIKAKKERRRKKRRGSLVAGSGANPQRKAGGKGKGGTGKAKWRTKERRVAVKMSKAVVAPSAAVFQQQLCSVRAARRDSAEDFSRLNALLCTAVDRVLIPAYCFAHS